MMKFIATTILLVSGFNLLAQDAFVTTWKTDNTGSSSDNQISIPTNSSLTYDYNVDWGDGTSDTGVSGNVTHTYASSGTYTVSITGDFPQIVFADGNNDKSKILTVEQWGDIAWQSMSDAFHGCDNLRILASDAPDLSLVTSMRNMFRRASTFNESIDHWNVSTITDMSFMFNYASSFDQVLNSWDVGQVFTMTFMFSNSPFNQPIDSWNVGNVTDMRAMFEFNQSFDQPIGSWDVSKVVSMERMFNFCPFNQPIGTWDVSSVTNMGGMFSNSLFNQALTDWNVSNVTNFETMLATRSFNHPIGQWDVSSATNMEGMFLNAESFDQDISSWDVSNVATMKNMFNNASSFNQSLENWNVSSVENMAGMFAAASQFNQPLDAWNLAKVAAIEDIFRGASSFNQNIDNWNVSLVSDFSRVFRLANSYNQPLDNWDVSSATEMNQMFEGASAFDQALTSWNVSGVTTMEQMFEGCTAFNQELGSWDVSSVTSFFSMFRDAVSFNQNIDDWNVVSATNMAGMFEGATSFNQPIGSWNVGNVVEMAVMFSEAQSFNQNINDWNVSNVVNMNGMFEGTPFNQPLANWDVTNVTAMEQMFWRASSFNQPLANWSVSNVEGMNWMFLDAAAFDQSLGDWDISSVQEMNSIFDRTSLSVGNYDATLSGWAGLSNLQENVAVGASTLRYCLGESSRQKLIDDFGWTFNGDAIQCIDGGNPVPGLARSGAVGFSAMNSSFFGLGQNEDGYFEDFYLIDFEDETLDAISAFPGVPRSEAVSFVINDNAYVGLGQDENGNYLSDFYMYDPFTDSWHQVADFGGGARSDAVAFAIGEFGYVGTGINDSDEQKDFWRFDPSLNSWIQTAELPSDKRRSAFAFEINGKGYVGGGFNFDGFSFQLSDIQEYDPNTDTWTERIFADGINLSVNNAAAFSLYGNGYIAYGNKDDLIKYNPRTNEVENLGDVFGLGDDRNDPVAFVLGDSAIFGLGSFGFLPTEYSNTFNFYYEENITPTELTLDNSLVTENNASGELVGVLSVQDEDESLGHSFELALGDGSNDVDNSSFTIVGNQLSTNDVFDFEAKEVYRVFVQATDSRGGSIAEAFVVQVQNQNEPPTKLELSSTSLPETLDPNPDTNWGVGFFSTEDEDLNDVHTYAIIPGDGTNDKDNHRFSIGSTGSEAQLLMNLPNFEEGSEYNVNCEVRDLDGLTFQRAFVITITDVNDLPTALTFEQGEVLDTDPVGTVVGTFSTVDEDDTEFTYRLINGTGTAFRIQDDQLVTNSDLKLLELTQDGLITIDVETSDSAGETLIENFDVLITYVEVLGVKEIEELIIYPNPATDKLSLQLDEFLSERLMIEVMTLDGKLVLKEREKITSSELQLDISSMAAGSYVIRVAGNERVLKQVFRKQ